MSIVAWQNCGTVLSAVPPLICPTLKVIPRP
jgi:hypothetical protein